MRPHPEELVRILQTGVLSHFAPELQSSYAKAQFGFSMLLFGLATRNADAAVPDLMDENSALRALLAEARDAMARIDGRGAPQAAAAIDALAPPADSLRLAALRAENDAIRAVLAGMAPLIEAAGDDEALLPLRDVRARIYEHLQAAARKRIVPILSA